KCNVAAALINPAVGPHRLLEAYLGEQVNPYTGERYRLTKEHMQQLEMLDCEPIQHTKNILLLAQLGDEVLDTQLAIKKYQGCEQIIEAGGSHAFDGFSRHIPTILKFFQFI
ncbi:MAG TPA: YqiA/YcfP family alpha/beta fold hydrolase, partial [Pseudomonadales bacterium]|nr:YqiA/YcfP family alpha/beta fold hydrolase [Pseudomonadales bacterium]